MMEKYGKISMDEGLRGPWRSAGTCLETKSLEPKLPKEQRVGQTYLLIPTDTINVSGRKPEFV